MSQQHRERGAQSVAARERALLLSIKNLAAGSSEAKQSIGKAWGRHAPEGEALHKIAL